MKDLHKGTALRSALSKWLPRLDVYVLGWILTFGSLLITTSLWTAARFPLVASSDLWPWRALSQLTILWSITLMATAMLAMLPPVLVVVVMQRLFVRGLVETEK